MAPEWEPLVDGLVIRSFWVPDGLDILSCCEPDDDIPRSCVPDPGELDGGDCCANAGSDSVAATVAMTSLFMAFSVGDRRRRRAARRLDP
jgi:hypothetical protein